MRKEIDPELYNYNKFPGPVFHQVGDQIRSENLSFELLKNEKEAFDATVFGQRFTLLVIGAMSSCACVSSIRKSAMLQRWTN